MLVHIKLLGWGRREADKQTCYISTNSSVSLLELVKIGPSVIYRALATPRCPLTDKHGNIYETKCKGKLGDRA